MKLILGDCLEKLKELEDNSVDAIVTDPPYGISFMGKKWDYDVPKVEVWKECLRVLKPGGYLLSFAGTRTQHRMAVNIEDAGFEIRDMIAWVYGCLSEDTEVLTQMGYKQFHKLTQYDKIAVYDIKKDIYQWERPQRWSVYSVHKDTAYRIKSDYTDQIVSRNHRCLVEREGKLVFIQAEELDEVEYMPTLSEDFYSLQKNSNRKLLLKELLWKGKGLAQKVFSKWTRKEMPSERIEVRKEPSLERWSNLLEETRKLQADKICEVSKGVFTDGEKRWICNGTSFDNGSILGDMFRENPSSASYQSRPTGQPTGKPDVISIKQGTQITRRARVTKIEYSGIIFCPTVSTGAFVARRNGQVFITGNSGFPKSLNIGKAVDKLQGNERKVTGKKDYAPGWHKEHTQNDDSWTGGEDKGLNITKGTSQWEGWGTALKPALEPITVARKPLEKGLNVAENCLKWGVGGINIDGCRVETEDKMSYSSSEKKGVTQFGTGTTEQNELGRFPANLIHDGSEEVVGLFPQTKGGGSQNGSRKWKGEEGEGGFGGWAGKVPTGNYISRDNGTGSAARFFMSCKYTPKDAIMNICEDSIYVNNVGNSLPIMSLIESVVSISSVLKSATPNLDLLNHYLNVLFVEKKSESIVIDFVAKLVAISEVPEGVLNQQELTVIQDFITSCKGCSQTQNPVSSVGKWEDTDITQIIINLLRLCGYVLLATEENTNSGKREVGVVNGEPKRFLYCSKASKRERNMGCEGLEEKETKRYGDFEGTPEHAPKLGVKNTNNHPTVKPLALMEYLVKMVSREGQVVLDPFMGSGTTGMACKKLGRDFVGIEMMEEYMEIAKCRIEAWEIDEQLELSKLTTK